MEFWDGNTLPVALDMACFLAPSSVKHSLVFDISVRLFQPALGFHLEDSICSNV